MSSFCALCDRRCLRRVERVCCCLMACVCWMSVAILACTNSCNISTSSELSYISTYKHMHPVSSGVRCDCRCFWCCCNCQLEHVIHFACEMQPPRQVPANQRGYENKEKDMESLGAEWFANIVVCGTVAGCSLSALATSTRVKRDASVTQSRCRSSFGGCCIVIVLSDPSTHLLTQHNICFNALQRSDKDVTKASVRAEIAAEVFKFVLFRSSVVEYRDGNSGGTSQQHF